MWALLKLISEASGSPLDKRAGLQPQLTSLSREPSIIYLPYIKCFFFILNNEGLVKDYSKVGIFSRFEISECYTKTLKKIV